MCYLMKVAFNYFQDIKMRINKCKGCNENRKKYQMKGNTL